MIASSPTGLIQEFTQHKINAAIDTIDSVLAKSHPFKESRDALRAIREHIVGLRSRVTNRNHTLEVAKTSCRAVLEQLAEAMPLVGFLERATEVKGPVEFHGPFSRLIRSLLGNDARLILSSTWVFAPYTRIYPREGPKGLENHVYVSFCMSESDNALLTPLAAHEIGHNIWKILDLAKEFSPLVGEYIVTTIQEEFQSEWQRIGPANKAEDLIEQTKWQQAAYWAHKQIEECFCDYIGLYLFGPCYIYAFAHFSAPGTGAGEPTYPQAHERFSLLVDAAEKEGWKVNTAFSKLLFEVAVRPTSVDTSPNRDLLLKIADSARRRLNVAVQAKARAVVLSEALLYSDTNIETFATCFHAGVPCSSAKDLPQIVNAGWQTLIEKLYASKEYSNWGFPISETQKVINELLLKSFEIFEIENRLREAECSTQQKSLI